MTTTTVTSDQLETFAFESGQTITLRRNHAELRHAGRVFIAPLTIPAQRKPGEGS